MKVLFYLADREVAIMEDQTAPVVFDDGVDIDDAIFGAACSSGSANQQPPAVAKAIAFSPFWFPSACCFGSPQSRLSFCLFPVVWLSLSLSVCLLV